MYIELLEFIEEPSKPPFLYHGSPHKLDVIEPNQATGLGNRENDRLYSVYASDERNYAIMFALNIFLDEKGERSWSIFRTADSLEVVIETGKLDLTTQGYLYRLPSDTFRQVERFQWVSDVPVKPLECEIIKPKDHLHWLRYNE
ncbi:hypothetical protein IQ247_04060 [Plectonema cf. radiosum LEGE 06105]|uniref:Uncharacterized protein n=1 Tax=Plectonema cf. radiosum LEGE 06105 TaxID=945769 RepID=A0A8J7K1H7_9CYAN|nr:hypothetical protein [Plectonema radiosum]MBE9211902.1 hypothetical protein [Plectonema cf. radiosum LEGE 06105]